MGTIIELTDAMNAIEARKRELIENRKAMHPSGDEALSAFLAQEENWVLLASAQRAVGTVAVAINAHEPFGALSNCDHFDEIADDLELAHLCMRQLASRYNETPSDR